MAAEVLDPWPHVLTAPQMLTDRRGSCQLYFWQQPDPAEDCYSTHVGRRHRQRGSGTSWLPVRPCVRIRSTFSPTSRAFETWDESASGETARTDYSAATQDCVDGMPRISFDHLHSSLL